LKDHTSYPSSPRIVKTFAIAVVLSLFASTFAVVAATSGASAQVDTFGTAEVTPESALVYVRANLDTGSDQWTLADELLDRSGISEVSGEEISLDMISEVEPDISGEVAFVLTKIDPEQPVNLDEVSDVAIDPESVTTDIPSGFAVVYQPDDIESIASFIEESIAPSGEDVETSEYEGVTIQFAPPVDEFSDGYAYAQVNDETIAIATVPEDLEPIIDTVNGDIEPISGVEEFTSIQGKLADESLVFGYVDGAAILDQVLALDPEAAAALPEETVAQARATVGMVFHADDVGFRFDSIVVPGPDAELPELTTFQPSLDERVSSDSLVFLTGSDLGPSGSLDALGLVLAQLFVGVDPLATPVPADDADAYAEEIFAQAEAQIGFNLKTDFIDQLVGEFATSVSVSNIESGVPEIDAVFVSGVDNPTTVNDVLSKISFLAASAAPEESVTSRDLADGTSLYQFNVGDETFPMIIEFGVIEDQLVIGLNNGIDEYVEGPESALADDENYQTVFSNLPEDITGAAFINVPQILPIIDTFASSMASSTPDNDPACAEFDSQEEAQEAYEEEFNFDLDLDFDGEACEDFFAPATPSASPVSSTDALNILGIGTVTYDADGDIGQSTLIAIGD
jgi:hypothetical protein